MRSGLEEINDEISRVTSQIGANQTILALRGLRVLLEMVLRRIGEDAGTTSDEYSLFELIGELHRRQVISQKEAAIAHRVRKVGNRAIHGDHVSDDSVTFSKRCLDDVLFIHNSSLGPGSATEDYEEALDQALVERASSTTRIYLRRAGSPPWSRVYRDESFIFGRNSLRGSGCASNEPYLAILIPTTMGWEIEARGIASIRLDDRRIQRGEVVRFGRQGVLAIDDWSCQYEIVEEDESNAH